MFILHGSGFHTEISRPAYYISLAHLLAHVPLLSPPCCLSCYPHVPMSSLLFSCYVTIIAGSALGETCNPALKLLGYPRKHSWVSIPVFNSLPLLEEVLCGSVLSKTRAADTSTFPLNRRVKESTSLGSNHNLIVSTPGKLKANSGSHVPQEWQGFFYSLLLCW